MCFYGYRASENTTTVVSQMVNKMLDPSHYNKKIRPGADKGMIPYTVPIQYHVL